MQTVTEYNNVTWWQPVLFAAMAGGMAWGIRGQYGHETGAMIAGLLVSLTLVYLLAPKLNLSTAGRAVAWGTIAMGFGGSMTYGQTVGLTHDAPLVGNWEALRWGLLGLAVKGGMWIGFAGVFLGMGLGGKRYETESVVKLMLVLIAAFFLGGYVLNSPFEPYVRRLPEIYFSDDWYWEPGSDLKPRPEVWGGMVFAYLVLLFYVSVFKRDWLALNLGLWGLIGGAAGFPAGQSLQAFHAWNREMFGQGIWQQWDQYMNWWNWMETTFGAIMGAFLGLGLWLNQRKITNVDPNREGALPIDISLILLVIHLVLLFFVEFRAIGYVDMFYDHGLILGLIPIAAAARGRIWPFLILFPVTLFPIAGKTVRQLVYNEGMINASLGWSLYFVIPLLLALGMAVWFIRQDKTTIAKPWMGYALLFNAWIFFVLNYAFFQFPFPWTEWTRRTPNGIIFSLCVIGLTACVLLYRNNQSHKDG